MASPILFGKYHLIEKISAGGMAEVFKAKSYGVAGFEKLLVIKKILSHLGSDQEFVGMFKDEAQISASLSHGNIVQVIDFGKEGDSYFMAMEYVHGYDLSRVIMKGRQAEDEVPRELCLFVLCEVLKALDYAHRRSRNQEPLNIVHCDVSPQNVLLSFEGEVKLTDFGISKAAFQSASSQGVVRGKYAYMSPEQVEGKPLDRRSDIFSIGIILWELLTGKRLFKTDNVEKTLRKVLSGSIPSPSEISPTVHPELDRITLKALSRDPEERFQEDSEMLEDLSAFMFSDGMYITSTDLGEYLRRVFAKELQRARESEQSMGSSLARGAAGNKRRTLFIPVGSGRSVPSFQPAADALAATALTRIGVVSMCAEWNYSASETISSAERARQMRDLVQRFECRIEGTGGELWEVNHNSLIACWRIGEDPARSMSLAVDCAFGLREEVATALKSDSNTCVLDVGLHAGGVVVERRSGNPLCGWQITRTFGIPRALVNLNSLSGLIVVSERGQILGANRFVCKSRRLPGRAESFLPDAFEVTSALPGPEAAKPKFTPYTRYLGRETMLAKLVDRLRDAAEARPSVALLCGGEGAGRSRLREEFSQACRRLGASLFVGSCLSGQRHHAYPTMLNALRGICGISPPESFEDERHKLARLNQLGLSEDDIDLVHSLFDESHTQYDKRLDPNRKASVFALFDKVITGLAKDAPLVLALEEFQLADQLSEEYIGHLAVNLGSQRLVLLLEIPEDFQRPWLDKLPVTRLSFEALPSGLAEEMIKDMLGVMEVTPDLLHSVLDLAKGNPLLLKEYVSHMIEGDYIEVEEREASIASSGDRPPLPSDTLELLAQRFHRVPRDVRLLLKAGAVIGNAFPLSVLEKLLPEAKNLRESLHRAVTLGVLKERQTGAVTYFRFRHTHFHKLALGLPIQPARAEIQARLVQGLRNWVPHGRGNLVETEAFLHWSTESEEAASSLELAGDKLFFEHGFTSALIYYRRAFQLHKSEKPGFEHHRRRLRRKIARALLQQSVFSDSDDFLRNGLASAKRAGAEPQAAEFLIELSEQHWSRGEAERAIGLLREALALAHKGDSQLRIAEVERELGRLLQLTGDTEEALHYLRAGYQRAKLEDDKAIVLNHATTIAAFYHQVGAFARARESYYKVLVAAKECGDKSLLLTALHGLAEVYRDVNRSEVSARCYKEALNLARALEDKHAQSQIMCGIGILCLRSGAPQRGYPYLEAALAISTSLGNLEMITAQRLFLAYLKGITTNPKTGLKEIQTVMSQPETGRLRYVVAWAHLLSGRCQLKLRENRRAREAFDRAIKVAQELQHAPLTTLATAAIGSIPVTSMGLYINSKG